MKILIIKNTTPRLQPILGIGAGEAQIEENKTTNVFKQFSAKALKEIYKILEKEYGKNTLNVVFQNLGVNDAPLADKVNALYLKAAEVETPEITEYPFDPTCISRYLRHVSESIALTALWDAIKNCEDEGLLQKMRLVNLSNDPLICRVQIREFLQENRTELERIDKLYFRHTQVRALPKEIAYFTHLRILDLEGNGLKDLPSEIRELKNLISLNLKGNQFVAFPNDILELRTLRMLNLDQNQLTQIPAEVAQLNHLLTLSVNNNNLSFLPNELGSLETLTHLYLENNALESLPDTIGGLKNLRRLYLFNNQLQSFPNTITQLTSLEGLSAPNNRLTHLPPDLTSLKNLKSLVLDNNQITVLPESISQLPNLSHLHVNKNQMVAIPSLMKARMISCEGNPVHLFPTNQALASVSESNFLDVYNKLGSEKWKEGIDGAYHHLGERVFDEGLHGGHVEPGFLNGILNAFQFLNNSFSRNLDANFYLELHRTACSHFQGDATQTLMGQEGIGVFRNKPVFATFEAPHYAMTQDAIDEFNGLNWRLASLFGSSFSLGTIERVKGSSTDYQILYADLTQTQVEMIFNFFVSEFHWKMNNLKYPDDKLEAIAELIQSLEWLHPPKDGCGRTDTLLLNFLLAKHGFVPVLLEYPYVSSCKDLKTWMQYIRFGMKNWIKADQSKSASATASLI